jgi:hypothetical protein
MGTFHDKLHAAFGPRDEAFNETMKTKHLHECPVVCMSIGHVEKSIIWKQETKGFCVSKIEQAQISMRLFYVYLMMVCAADP